MTTESLRVVHVITALNTGGAERQVELLAAASRHDVQVIALYEGGVVADAIRSRGAAVEVLGMVGMQKLTAVFRLAWRLRQLRPDVVHVHLLSGQLWGIPAARLARVPVVLSTEHSLMNTTVEGRPKTPRLRRLYRLLEMMTTHTIAVSSETARRLADWGIPAGPRMSVVNPPIDFLSLARTGSDREAVRADWGVPDGALVVGAVARLDPVKRLDQVIRALAERLGDNTHLVVVGDGPLRADLGQLATDLGVSSRVHLLGPQRDVPRLLEGLDLLVSPSRDETFGMAVVEALGAGLPVVYAECPALDGLDCPPHRAIRVSRVSSPDDERLELAAAVGALAGVERAPAPRQLVERYGAESTARTVDDLYAKLSCTERLRRRR